MQAFPLQPSAPARARHVPACAAAVLLAALALAACNRESPKPTAGEKLDSAIGQTERKLEDAKQSTADAARSAGTAIDDTAITASVKAKLAADPDLKMLDISVETRAGRTVLRGTAPNAAARERATQIAAGVTGVSGVDNELKVAP